MYYHPDFNGSYSINSVLRAMFPDDEAMDYKALDIQAGDMALMIQGTGLTFHTGKMQQCKL